MTDLGYRIAAVLLVKVLEYGEDGAKRYKDQNRNQVPHTRLT